MGPCFVAAARLASPPSGCRRRRRLVQRVSMRVRRVVVIAGAAMLSGAAVATVPAADTPAASDPVTANASTAPAPREPRWRGPAARSSRSGRSPRRRVRRTRSHRTRSWCRLVPRSPSVRSTSVPVARSHCSRSPAWYPTTVATAPTRTPRPAAPRRPRPAPITSTSPTPRWPIASFSAGSIFAVVRVSPTRPASCGRSSAQLHSDDPDSTETLRLLEHRRPAGGASIAAEAAAARAAAGRPRLPWRLIGRPTRHRGGMRLRGKRGEVVEVIASPTRPVTSGGSTGPPGTACSSSSTERRRNWTRWSTSPSWPRTRPRTGRRLGHLMPDGSARYGVRFPVAQAFPPPDLADICQISGRSRPRSTSLPGLPGTSPPSLRRRSDPSRAAAVAPDSSG